MINEERTTYRVMTEECCIFFTYVKQFTGCQHPDYVDLNDFNLELIAHYFGDNVAVSISLPRIIGETLKGILDGNYTVECDSALASGIGIDCR